VDDDGPICVHRPAQERQDTGPEGRPVDQAVVTDRCVVDVPRPEGPSVPVEQVVVRTEVLLVEQTRSIPRFRTNTS
jgi:hypothetical protein